MLHLIVKLNGEIQKQIPLENGKQYLIGRKPTCDVVIENQKGISREHIRITMTELGPLLEVLSKYGNVYADGAEVQSLNLAEGSQFNFLNHEFFILELDASGKAHPNQPSNQLTTQFANQPGLQSTSQPTVQPSDYEKTIVKVTSVVPHLKMVNVYNEPVELYRLEGGDSWIAGRDPNCNILIKDSKVSRRQFEIKKVDDHFGIVDLKSVNGTLVNGNLISTESITFLKSGDCITVLSNNFFFELHDAQYQEKVEKIVLPMIQSPNALQPRFPGMHLPAERYPDPAAHAQIPQPASEMLPVHAGLLMKIKQNKLRAGLGGVLAVLVIYFALASNSPNMDKRGIASINQQTDLLAALPEKQQTFVKQTYQLAKNYYMQGRYELARSEIAKMTEAIPEYLDSAEIDRLSGEAIALKEQKLRLEQVEKQKVEMEQQIQAKVVECRPVAAQTTQIEVLDRCIASVVELNPAHPELEKLRLLVDQNRVQQAMQEAQRAQHSALAARLRSMFQQASSAEAKGERLTAVRLYSQVTRSNLPDTGNYKAQAQRKIASVKSELSHLTGKWLAESDKAHKSGDLKNAILNLRKAQNIDPENSEIASKTDSYISELRKQMMGIYQESILEESFGNVEGAEGKQGAKDKWKRILQLDIPDGEYYKKARVKLKKYGAQ